MQRLLALSLSLGSLAGCVDRDLGPLNPCTVQSQIEVVGVDEVADVDLLFMIDNSNSMAVHQDRLSSELPNLVRILASGDLDGDGRQDFPPVRSLNVGVITSDMGTGGPELPTCAPYDFGDDGILRDRGNTARPGCEATYPTVQTFEPASAADPAVFASSVACVAVMGTNGCGIEQQLESVLKAVTPSSSDIRFHAGTVGHADGVNAGFLRPDSVLALILVTDEDDCSIRDPRINDLEDETFGGEINLRCHLHGTERYAQLGLDPNSSPVWGVERFVDGLLRVREDPSRIVFAAITGIPEELNPPPLTAIDYEGLLRSPRMQAFPDPEIPTQLAPSCLRPPPPGARDPERAFPPRRILRAGQLLERAGAKVVVQTICQDSFAGALQEVIAGLIDALGGACLARPLVRDGEGRVNCDVVEALPPGRRCDEVPGRAFLRDETTDGVTRTVCRVDQLAVRAGAVAPGAGWYYETAAESPEVADRCATNRPQRVSFQTRPMTGTIVRLECLQPVGDAGEPGQVGVGSDCASGCGTRVDGHRNALTCETSTNTCQPPCENDADCASGFVCAQGFCVNPTCE